MMPLSVALGRMAADTLAGCRLLREPGNADRTIWLLNQLAERKKKEGHSPALKAAIQALTKNQDKAIVEAAKAAL